MQLNDISKVLDDKIKEVQDVINEYAIELGVVDGTAPDRKEAGVNNAELMYIHEFGSPLRNIPSRPVLGPTVEEFVKEGGLIDKTVSRLIKHCIEEGIDRQYIEQQLKVLAKRMQNYARSYIREGRVEPQLPETNRRKKKDPSAVALDDTGQLMRSIICRLVKKSNLL